MTDKVIISNKAALQNKYSAAGFASLDSAIQALITADSGRGLNTRRIWIDDANEMKKYGGKPPVNSNDQRGNKLAVDSIAEKLQPDYIVLLDGPDVVPHIALSNPANDDDRSVDSDLPYASPAGFSKQASNYLKVTRVVGRIPNVPGAKDPKNIVAFLNTSINAQPGPKSGFQSYFGLSADVWKASTQMSLDAAFGDHSDLKVAPPAAPPNTNSQLKRKSHFINCHGAAISPEFYGQLGNQYPVAMTSAQVAANSAGAVVTAECCYGAQLYDPTLTGVDDPICIAYLLRGALGFLGSTNIAYGPSDSNAQADLMTQYFFEEVLSGASLGRSLLQARLQFIRSQKMTDPTNVKTLAQYILLGDPSVTPCTADVQSSPTHGIAGVESPSDISAQRKARRVRLASLGVSIVDSKAVTAGTGRVPPAVRERVRSIAKERGYQQTEEVVLKIRAASDYRAAMKAKKVEEHVMIVTERMKSPPHIIAIRHLVAHIMENGIASIEETVSR